VVDFLKVMNKDVRESWGSKKRKKQTKVEKPKYVEPEDTDEDMDSVDSQKESRAGNKMEVDDDESHDELERNKAKTGKGKGKAKEVDGNQGSMDQLDQSSDDDEEPLDIIRKGTTGGEQTNGGKGIGIKRKSMHEDDDKPNYQ
jgi:hypothetical protein